MELLLIFRRHISVFAHLVFLVANLISCQSNFPNPEENISKVNKSTKVRFFERQPFRYALSSNYLVYLARAEQKMYSDLTKYAESLKDRLKLTEQYLKDYEESTIKGIQNLSPNVNSWIKATEVAANPLMSYRMIRRFTKEFHALENNLEKSLKKELLESIKNLKGTSGFPDDKDHDDAIDTIQRIQIFYDVSPDDLVEGRVMGIESNVKLNPAQCHEFAEFALARRRYVLALPWLHTTKAEIDKQNDTSIGLMILANNYKNLIEWHDREFGTDGKVAGLKNYYMYDKKLSTNTNPNPPTQKQIKMKKHRGDRIGNITEITEHNFFILCNEGTQKSAKEFSELYCWLDKKRHPYFAINPLKIELLNKEPLLIQIYDVITTCWIYDLWRASAPIIKRDPPDENTGFQKTPTYAWLSDKDIPTVPISRRVELITGLKASSKSADLLQIASYSFGAHVQMHVDYSYATPLEEGVIPKGDRLATFMAYMSDVEKGGNTVFPHLGVSVRPVKGAALFWYVRLQDGQVDYRMRHGGCPVVVGHKWIMLKWIYQFQNVQTRKCDLNPDF